MSTPESAGASPHAGAPTPQRNGALPAYLTSSRRVSGPPSDPDRPGSSGGSNGGGGGGGGGSGRIPTAAELAAEAEAKRRKVQRACDVCRRKKIRCEGPMNSNSTNKYGLECTYVEAAKRRGPPKGYIEMVEQRCGRLERLILQLHPTFDIAAVVGPPPDRDDFELAHYQDSLRSFGIPPYPHIKALPPPELPLSIQVGTPSTAPGAPSPPPRVLGPAPWQPFEKDPNRPPDGDEARAQARLVLALVKLNIRDQEAFRFHGKASGAHLVSFINELKYSEADETFLDRINAVRRTEYWRVPEWEKVIATENVKPVDYSIWPDEELAQILIDNYFEHLNFYMPLLNRVLFDRQYQSGLWSTSTEFAKLCLMIFANGARYTDDERVYWPIEDATTPEGRDRLRSDHDGTLKYSAGWKYIRAIINMGRTWLRSPNLFDLQIHVLVCLFLNGTAVPHLAWLAAGGGLRQAQEIGIHVRSTLSTIDPIDRALYNRAFWCLYHFDRLSCAAIGRSVAIHDSDFDADYPIAVDDEYWDTGDPERDFKQPPGLPPDPAISAFTFMLKLDHVLGAALRTIYAINKLPEHGPDERAIVVELDSALNAWADSVPDNLRWDPTRSDKNLFEHSALLYAHYYYVQILIHRPFIPTRKHPENIGFPSLAICSNAARSICNILDAVLRRNRQWGSMPGHAINFAFALPASTAAIVLLMNVYGVRQRQQERERCINDVKRAIAAFREMELTYRQAGKMTDLISEIARESTGDFSPSSLDNLTPVTKRTYDDANDDPISLGTPGAPEIGPIHSGAIQHRQAHAAWEALGPGAPPLECMVDGSCPMGRKEGTPAGTPGATAVGPNANALGANGLAAAGLPSGVPCAGTSSVAGTNAPSPATPISGMWDQGYLQGGAHRSCSGVPAAAPVTGEPTLFEPNDLQNLNYAVMNFDMFSDTTGADFWTQLLRQPLPATAGAAQPAMNGFPGVPTHPTHPPPAPPPAPGAAQAQATAAAAAVAAGAAGQAPSTGPGPGQPQLHMWQQMYPWMPPENIPPHP